MQRVLELVYLMLPVYAANMAPPFSKFLPLWNRPISRRWLGDHKTVLGFIFGLLAGTFAAWVQSRIDWVGSLLDYRQWLPVGLACGLGAMCGDSLKSLFKRRLGIAPGHSWIPADQLDFVVGGLIVLSFWVSFSLADVVTILLVSFLGDIVVNHLAFWLKIRDTPW